MKKKSIIFIIIGIILIAVIGAVCFLDMNKTLYTLNLPKEADSFSSITLEQNGSARTIENSENIQNLMNKLVGTERTTYEESIQDIPVGMEEKMTITFNSGEKCTTIFVYKKADKYYIEQSYNGIYEITQEEYNDINKFYQDLREEVTNMEKTSLTNRVEKLDAANQQNVLFSVANEDEFTNAVESLDDSQKVLYTLTFERNGTFKLVNYEINEK